MTDYTEIQIRHECAAHYVKECLNNGWSLGESLLRHVDLGKGQFYTYCPQGADEPSEITLREGGYTSQPQSVQWLAQAVRSFLLSGADNVCVFENSAARPSHPWLSKARSRFFFFGDDVYHVLNHRDTDLETITITIGEAQSAWLSIACMGMSREIKEITSSGTRIESVDIFHRLAMQSTRVVVSAFDCEGFIMWRKAD